MGEVKNNGEDMMVYMTSVISPKFSYGYRINDLKFEEFGIMPGAVFFPVPFILGGGILNYQIFQCLSSHGFYVTVNEFDLKSRMKEKPEELEIVKFR